MRSCRVPLAVAVLCLASHVTAGRAAAQATDSVHWSLFTGRSISPAPGADQRYGFLTENFDVGGAVEFRSSLFPVPLRASVAYDRFRGGPFTTYKVTSLRMEGMFRPLPAVAGIRPYLLGGFGIATQSPTGTQDVSQGLPTFVPIERHTALQLNAGMGLEFRHFFAEYRRSPFTVAGSMPVQSWQINVGMRF